MKNKKMKRTLLIAGLISLIFSNEIFALCESDLERAYSKICKSFS